MGIACISVALQRPRVPIAKPTAVGLNCTLMMQVPVFAITRLFVQVVLVALTNGPVTVMAGLLSVIDTPVLLVSVIFVDALVTPTGVTAKLTEVRLSDTLLVPVPLNPMSCGVEGSLSLMTTEPRFAPVDFGLKVTLMVQLAPPARTAPEAGHVLVEMV